MVSKGFLDVVTSGQQYNIGEKPTVILYTCINCRDTETTQSKSYVISTTIKRPILIILLSKI